MYCPTGIVVEPPGEGVALLAFSVLGSAAMAAWGVMIARRRRIVFTQGGSRRLEGTAALVAGIAIVVSMAACGCLFAWGFICTWRGWMHG